MSHTPPTHPRTAFGSFLLLVLGLCSLVQARGEGLAIPGRPFGVGSVTVAVSPRASHDWKAISIEDSAGRVLYPALRTGLLPGAADQPAAPPSRVTISFLFTGDAPLDVTVRTPEVQRFTVLTSNQPPRIYRRQITRWWRDYNATARQEGERNDYPQLVHEYLVAMLGQRLGLQPPLLSRRAAKEQSELQKTVELLAGAESLRAEILRELMTQGITDQAADLPLPETVGWTPPQLPVTDDVEIEPIASHVPAECFYVRFGSFPNYLWLSKLMREYGGDIGRMISLRGQDAALNERLQNQLALKEGKLAEIFGAQVIADVALLGRDMYMAEGAAMGVLFHASNNFALSTDLRQQRSALQRQGKDEGTVLEEIEVRGNKVSFLSTPDNRIRSYYAVDGNFHLVTTSRSIVERFYAAGEGIGALADSGEFRNARRVIPMDRGDTIFAYFSSDFFQSLVSPEYLIELRRRLQADTTIRLIQLARLAARAEGFPDLSLSGLSAGGLLPASFGRLPDRSGPIVEEERSVDSRRGVRGWFTPIPDVAVTGVSLREAQWFQRKADFFQQDWRQMDPLIVGVQRVEGEQPGAERIIVDANISPLAEEKYGWLMSLLGAPSTHEVPPTNGDIISMQAMVKGGLLSDTIPPHHLFVGVKDSPIPVDPRPGGLFQILNTLRQTPGYLGAWPQLGFLDWLPMIGLAGHPDVAGFSPLPLGAWRWQGGGFSVVSFQHPVLAQSVQELQLVPTDNPAQIRLRVGDLSQSALTGWINYQNYERARQASFGNVRLMRTLTQQLRVPLPEARTEAEKFVNGKLVCALGGEYQLVEEYGVTSWQSTAWPLPGEPMSAEYLAPLLGWFRGLRLDLTKQGGRLVMHTELDMQRQATEKKPALPNLLDLFGGSKDES